MDLHEVDLFSTLERCFEGKKWCSDTVPVQMIALSAPRERRPEGPEAGRRRPKFPMSIRVSAAVGLWRLQSLREEPRTVPCAFHGVKQRANVCPVDISSPLEPPRSPAKSKIASLKKGDKTPCLDASGVVRAWEDVLVNARRCCGCGALSSFKLERCREQHQIQSRQENRGGQWVSGDVGQPHRWVSSYDGLVWPDEWH
jgi:hypothetical protein